MLSSKGTVTTIASVEGHDDSMADTIADETNPFEYQTTLKSCAAARAPSSHCAQKSEPASACVTMVSTRGHLASA